MSERNFNGGYQAAVRSSADSYNSRAVHGN
jgi:hypothetical protein